MFFKAFKWLIITKYNFNKQLLNHFLMVVIMKWNTCTHRLADCHC